jgi:predicted AlkP superfamily pyrophosphatase or phosphodiesterase
MSDNGLSKVFAISIKDRAAILPGGHMANGAYWYDGKSGKLISSTYYMKELPNWVEQFNDKKIPTALMNKDWKLESNKNYRVSFPDNGPGEEDVFKEGKTTFPHSFTKLSDIEKQELIRSTPYGNDLLTDFLITLLKNEKPGQGDFCDFVAVSFSSTDYVGHAYGPNSVEIMDTYLKLDKQIARLLDTLDQFVGKDNYLLFLTADHGVKPNNAYLDANRILSGNVSLNSIREPLMGFCKLQYGVSKIVEAVQDNQVYLNYKILDSLKLNVNDVCGKLKSFMRSTFPFMWTILLKEELGTRIPSRSMNSFILNGFNLQRSGDISFDLIQNYLVANSGEEGTSHESSYDYDTHIPLIFFGWHIKSGESNRECFVEDIAPTISNLIHIQEPDATIGVPIIK